MPDLSRPSFHRPAGDETPVEPLTPPPASGTETPWTWATNTPGLQSGVESPAALLKHDQGKDYFEHHKVLAEALTQTKSQTHRGHGHAAHGSTAYPEPVLLSDQTAGEGILELALVHSRRRESTIGIPPEAALDSDDSSPGAMTPPAKKAAAVSALNRGGVPPELKNLAAEAVFVLVNTAGQLIFSLTLGHVMVTQSQFRTALDIQASQVPWLIGSSLLASGLSVIISGSLADLAPPKPMMVGAFAWQALWNAIAAIAIAVDGPGLKILFFVARAMGGLSVGILVSASMSILGRVYAPGLRKTQVFSLMAAGAPLGFWIGCLQGGALAYNLPWIFGSTSMFLALCAVAAQFTIPSLRPAADVTGSAAPSLREFDYLGALLASVGCALVLFGLTQGSSANWNPYTYSLIIAGIAMFVAFYFVENRVARPLIPNVLWKTPGFAALMLAYFLGFGGFSKFSRTPTFPPLFCLFPNPGRKYGVYVMHKCIPVVA